MLQDALHAHDWMLARREQLERALGELAERSPWAEMISRLRCLRGINTLSAVGLVAEIGDFQRFSHPRKARRLPRPGTERGHKRRAAPPGRDHQSRPQTRPPAAGRGGLALPQPAPYQQRPGAPPTRPGPTRDRRRLALPTTPLQALATTRHPARQTPHPGRRGRRARALDLLLGARHALIHNPRLSRRREDGRFAQRTHWLAMALWATTPGRARFKTASQRRNDGHEVPSPRISG